MIPFLTAELSEDDFQELVMICYQTQAVSKRDFDLRAASAIRAYFSSRKAECIRSKRNLSLDQCIGESKVPVSEWLNLSEQIE